MYILEVIKSYCSELRGNAKMKVISMIFRSPSIRVVLWLNNRGYVPNSIVKKVLKVCTRLIRTPVS